jgi:DNA/RNA endonuclease YhcR with UshA esterase domain
MKFHLCFFLIASLFGFTETWAGQPTTAIRKARNLALGSEVTVSGAVTVLPGTFSSSSNDQGFAIHDQTAGIYVSLQKRIKLRLGQTVLVAGILGESDGRLQLVPPSSSEVHSLHEKTLLISTGSVGESTVGSLVTIEGAITKTGVNQDAPYGSFVFLDDGSGLAKVYLNASTNIDSHAAYLKKGRRIRVTGYINQFGSGYEIDPRSRQDIVPLK